MCSGRSRPGSGLHSPDSAALLTDPGAPQGDYAMTTTAHKRVLMNARALISSRAHWTRSKLACTADGRRVEPHDPSAAKWCAMGAILRAAHDLVGDGEEARRIGDA